MSRLPEVARQDPPVFGLVACVASLMLSVLIVPARAGDEDIAKQLSNPVADLISFPIQSNFDFNVGRNDGYRVTTNIQPVIPIKLNADWNLISRTIVPVIYQNNIAGFSGQQFGLGDTLQSLFFSPAKPLPTPIGNLIWGAGPAIYVPTSTDRLLGLGTWSAGPTAVVVVQNGGWTYGALANHLWGFAATRSGGSDLSASFVQPFLAYTTSDAWTFSVTAELTYDWNAKDLTGPINFAVSKLVRIGQLPVSIQGRVRWWAATTPNTPEGLGFTLATTFVFPTK